MIDTFYHRGTGQRLSILDYDQSRTNNVRYRAVINDDQTAVLHLQSVDIKDSHQDVSQLSLCPGVLESDVVVTSSSITKFLIEKVEDEIVYRSRDCFLLFSKEETGQLCQFCQDVFRDIKVDTDIKYDEEEKFALLNSFQQFVSNDYEAELESDHFEEPDVKTDPMYEVKEKTKPKVLKKKKKVTKKDNEDPSCEPGEAEKKKKKFPYECEYCPERFTSKQALQKHLNHQHPELKQDKCPFCEEMIGKYSRSWTVHLSTYHLQEKESPLYIEIMERINIKKFICTECGRDFNTNTSLEYHMMGTHNSHANTINCDQCGKFFKSFDTLGKHKRDIHENAFRKRLCVHCGKILKSKADLVDHIQRHHSDEKFPCQECLRNFSTNKDLLSHIRRNHTKREKVRTY